MIRLVYFLVLFLFSLISGGGLSEKPKSEYELTTASKIQTWKLNLTTDANCFFIF
ncbi:hypothetical protein [Galbibacter mesophilus]|uniref:hypothetical protein n=1 Tax=Galbibacter mesophilus TaxID=379069 RepID=UPI00191EB744|nr:hypothetical protein [Galbibacter mesophilus]